MLLSPPRFSSALYTVTAGAAILAWVVPWATLGGMDAWDHRSYFTISLPLMMVIAGWVGYLAKSRPWRWPLVMLLAQAITALILRGGDPGNLFPLVFIIFAVFSVPIAIAAWVGAWLSTRGQSEHDS